MKVSAFLLSVGTSLAITNLRVRSFHSTVPGSRARSIHFTLRRLTMSFKKLFAVAIILVLLIGTFAVGSYVAAQGKAKEKAYSGLYKRISASSAI